MACILLASIHPTYKRGMAHISLACHAPLIIDYSTASKCLLTRKCDIALEQYHICTASTIMMHDLSSTYFFSQLLVGTPGNEPEEGARDFIKGYYQYYPCGVYWYDVSSELILETCVKVATEVHLM